MSEILIIGTGKMARTYFRHFKALHKNPLMSYRNKFSQNYDQALKEFGKESLLDQSRSYELNPKYIFCCTSTNGHLDALKPFIDKNNFLFSEKPTSLEIDEIKTFPRKDLRVLMNRRYYSWVKKLKKLAETNQILKVIVNIPEKHNGEKWLQNIPIRLISNTIHIFDLCFYILGTHNKAHYKDISDMNCNFITSSKNVKCIFYNINYNSIENFSIKFYLKDHSIIKICPIEKGKYFKNFVIKNTGSNFSNKQYIPKATYFKNKKNKFILQKPGILELCQDIINNNFTHEKSILPTINDSLLIMNWLKNMWL